MKSTKTVLMSLFVVAAMIPGAGFAAKATKEKMKKEEMVVDAANSKVVWLGKKIKGEHTGTIAVKEGTIDYKGNDIVGGKVVIDIKSLTNTDLTDAEYNKKLVDHLKGADFFDAEKFPTATFKITKFEEIHTFAPGEPNALVKGSLTIRGKTKPFESKLFYTAKDGKAEIKGKMEIDRTQFGLKYSSKKFFSLEKLGDKMIEDLFTVDLNLVAMKK
jgi:polyisoprenoid-binding protein YceI